MTTVLSTRVSARFGASKTRATRAATRDRVGTMSDRHARGRALATRAARGSLDARARRSRSFRSRVSLDARASDEEDETRGGSTGASATRLGADDDAAPVSAGPREDLEFAFGADYSGDALSTQGEAVVKGRERSGRTGLWDREVAETVLMRSRKSGRRQTLTTKRTSRSGNQVYRY